MEAASLISEAVPNRTTRTSNSPKVRSPRPQASGIRVNSTALARSVTIMSGRRRTRSTKAPTTRPKTRYGSQRAELSQPTSTAVPWRVTTTSVCNASNVIALPKPDTASPHQKRRNPGARPRPGFFGVTRRLSQTVCRQSR